MSHDGCGCGHAHAETEVAMPTEHAHGDDHAHADEHGCGGGSCGGGSCGSGSCGDGCCGGSEGQLQGDEVAALRGFLSGLYASRLGEKELVEYLEAMTKQQASEFTRPAEFLLGLWNELGPVEPKGSEPVAWRILDAVDDGA